MNHNAQKTPLVQKLNEFAETKIRNAISNLGKALPASVVSVSGSIVTVKFEVQQAPFTLPQVTIPLAGSEYIRLPIQPGCKGVVFPSDVSLGGLSGLGTGVASFKQVGNLSSLVFFPFGTTGFSATDDANAVVIYGPNGVVLRDTGKNCIITANSTTITINGKNSCTMEVGGNNVTVNASGVQINGVLTINGKAYLAHDHTLVQPGSGTSGPVGP